LVGYYSCNNKIFRIKIGMCGGCKNKDAICMRKNAVNRINNFLVDRGITLTFRWVILSGSSYTLSIRSVTLGGSRIAMNFR
jgi:hypothetical protein